MRVAKELCKPVHERQAMHINPNLLRVMVQGEDARTKAKLERIIATYDLDSLGDNIIDMEMCKILKPDAFAQYCAQREAAEPGWRFIPYHMKPKQGATRRWVMAGELDNFSMEDILEISTIMNDLACHQSKFATIHHSQHKPKQAANTESDATVTCNKESVTGKQSGNEEVTQTLTEYEQRLVGTGPMCCQPCQNRFTKIARKLFFQNTDKRQPGQK